MAKNKIVDIATGIVNDFLSSEDGKELELYHLEFVKEGPDKVLRVYIDRVPSGEEEYVSTDDCELVSKYLSDKLDERDPIEGNYVLEVSSPGMDRVLIKEEHFKRYIGEMIEVSLFKELAEEKEPVDRLPDGKQAKKKKEKKGSKKIEGLLKSYDNGDISLIPINPEGKELKEIKIESNNIAKVNLAVVI